jgi:hypothetical protein
MQNAKSSEPNTVLRSLDIGTRCPRCNAGRNCEDEPDNRGGSGARLRAGGRRFVSSDSVQAPWEHGDSKVVVS